MSKFEDAEWKLDCLNSRMDSLARSDAAGAVKIKDQLYDGVKYIPLEARETSDWKVLDIYLDGKLMERNVPFGELHSKMAAIKKSQSQPVPKKIVERGGYQSEMSVFFPKARR